MKVHLEMFLEIIFSGVAKYPVQLFEDFQNQIALQVWGLAFTKSFKQLANETVLGQSSSNSFGGKICKIF